MFTYPRMLIIFVTLALAFVVRVGEERRYSNGVPQSSTPFWELYLELFKLWSTLERTRNAVPLDEKKFPFLNRLLKSTRFTWLCEVNSLVN